MKTDARTCELTNLSANDQAAIDATARKEEICVVSYPKSGRTWLRVLIGKALCEQYRLDEQLIFDEQNLALATGLPAKLYTHDGSSNTEGKHYIDLLSSRASYANKKVLLLVRDPRDVVVSCYFEASKRRGIYSGSISDFIRNDHYGIRKIVTFHNAWHANRQIPQAFLVLRYEEMRHDPKSSLRTVLDFIGTPKMDASVLDAAVRYASFNSMKRMEQQMRFPGKKLRPADPGDEESYKVRRGKVGGYADYLSPDDQRYANGVIDELGGAFYGR